MTDGKSTNTIVGWGLPNCASQSDSNKIQVELIEEIDKLEKEENEVSSPSRYRLDKELDPKAFKQMEEAFLPFVDDECLRECHHMYNTQLNESLNRSFSKFAPKDKTFSKSQSLFG